MTTLASASPLDQLHRRLSEAYDELWDNFVDPRGATDDREGRWLALTASADSTCATIASDRQLAEIRRECRQLALENEFAINGHENRISYIVGPGHTYRAALRKGCAAMPLAENRQPAQLALAVQEVLDAFIRENEWQLRQQEIVRRRDRDGEVFLRFFTAPDGATRVRFVEPDQIATPPAQAANPAARLGILTDRDDVEAILGYWIDGQLVDAASIQHRKANVDANVRRGLPLFYPVRKNLRRAEKLLRNMSVVAEIQSAIALIRKHRHGTAAGVKQFVAAQQNAAAPAQRDSVRRYGPGTILDAHADIDYDFPAAGIDVANFVAVLQAELRAIASRLVMPEFMLTSDASNANYASTMVSEGPAMRMFSRLQAEQVQSDLAVMRRVVEGAVAAGHLPPDVRTLVEIQAVPPSLAVRDQLQETQRHRLQHAAGILSPQTWSQLAGLDYDQEQINFASHRSADSVG